MPAEAFRKQPEDALERHREDCGIRSEQRVVAQRHASGANFADAAVQPGDDAVSPHPSAQFVAVEPAERNRRDVDRVPVARAEEAIDEDLAGVLQADVRHRFVERGHEDDAPEAIEDPPRLKVPDQPRFQRRVGIGRHHRQSGDAVGDSQFLRRREVVRPEQRAAEVERGGPRVGGEDAFAAVRSAEPELRLRFEQAAHAEGFAEAVEGGAAAHADVLAGIDEFARRGIGEARRPPAEAGPRFEQRDGVPAPGEGHRRRETRQSAADHDHARHRFAQAPAANLSFSTPLRRTRQSKLSVPASAIRSSSCE